MVFVNVTRYLARRSIFNSMDTLGTFDRVLLCTVLYFPLIPLRIKNSIRLAKSLKTRSEKKILGFRRTFMDEILLTWRFIQRNRSERIKCSAIRPTSTMNFIRLSPIPWFFFCESRLLP